VRAAGVDLLGVDQGGVEQDADRLGPPELASEGVQAGQQPVGEADLDRAADRWAAGLALGLDRAEVFLDCGIVAIGDQDTCPDVEVFAQGVRSALDELARSVLVPAS
jgi:hypothetical protein